MAEVEAALSSNKKFKMEITGELITLNLVDEADTATAIAIRNKVLNTTVKGVPDIERVTLVQKDDEWVIQTTGSNIAKVLEVKGIDKKMSEQTMSLKLQELWELRLQEIH